MGIASFSSQSGDHNTQPLKIDEIYYDFPRLWFTDLRPFDMGAECPVLSPRTFAMGQSAATENQRCIWCCGKQTSPAWSRCNSLFLFLQYSYYALADISLPWATGVLVAFLLPNSIPFNPKHSWYQKLSTNVQPYLHSQLGTRAHGLMTSSVPSPQHTQNAHASSEYTASPQDSSWIDATVLVAQHHWYNHTWSKNDVREPIDRVSWSRDTASSVLHWSVDCILLLLSIDARFRI